MLDDRRRARRSRGDGRNFAGHRLDQDLPELLALGREHDRLGSREERRQSFLSLPARETDVRHSESSGDICRVLALPFARMAADQDQRGRVREPRLRLSEGVDQPIETLHRGEPSHVEQRDPADQAIDGGCVVTGAAGRLAGQPALGLLDEHVSPEGTPIDRPPGEQVGVDPVGQCDDAITWHAQQRQRPARPPMG